MKKKRTCTTLSILLLTLALLLSSCQGAAEPMETGETKETVATTVATTVAATTQPKPVETLEKDVYVQGSKPWDDEYDTIYVITQPQFDDITYTLSDFSETEYRWAGRTSGYTGPGRAYLLRPKDISEDNMIRLINELAAREYIWYVYPYDHARWDAASN